MNKSKVLPIFGIFLLVMLSITLASAANTITLNTPAASGVVSGATYLINATMDTNSANVTQMKFYYKIDGGSWNLIGTDTNASDQDTHYSVSFDSTAIIDRINMTFNATGLNVSNAVITDDTSVSVSINNGVPTASFGSGTTVADGANLQPSQSFTVESGVDSTIGIRNCTIWLGTGSISVDGSGNQCSTSTTVSAFGVSLGSYHDLKIQVRDYNGNVTNTTSRTILAMDAAGGGSGGSSNSNTQTTTKTTTSTGVTTKLGFFESLRNWFMSLFN